MDAPHVYVHAWALCCIYSLVSTQTFLEGADSVSGQLHSEDKECPFSGITSSGRVWRKVLESGAQSVSGHLGEVAAPITTAPSDRSQGVCI